MKDSDNDIYSSKRLERLERHVELYSEMVDIVSKCERCSTLMKQAARSHYRKYGTKDD
jgi:hypothetical protein